MLHNPSTRKYLIYNKKKQTETPASLNRGLINIFIFLSVQEESLQISNKKSNGIKRKKSHAILPNITYIKNKNEINLKIQERLQAALKLHRFLSLVSPF